MTIVFSGFRDKGASDLYPDLFRNYNLTTQIRQRGGKVSTSVTRNTTFLIYKDINSQTGKIRDAEEKGVRAISLDEFVHTYLLS